MPARGRSRTEPVKDVVSNDDKILARPELPKLTTIRLVLALTMTIVAFASIPARPVGAQVANVIDDPEMYAVYTSVLPSGFGSADKTLGRFAFLQETRSKMTCQPEETIQPEWRPIWESYKRENTSTRSLLPCFNLGLPYVLVSLAEVKVLLAQAGNDGTALRGGWPEAYTRFPNGKLLAVSAVGFDELKTRAVVSVQYNCGLSRNPQSLEYDCHGGYNATLLKEDGHWVLAKANAPSCAWIG
jgi:hypothetical protein